MNAFPAHLADSMYALRRSEFKNVSVTDDSITIGNVSVSLRKNNYWSFKFDQEGDDWSVLSSESNDSCFRQVLTVEHEK